MVTARSLYHTDWDMECCQCQTSICVALELAHVYFSTWETHQPMREQYFNFHQSEAQVIVVLMVMILHSKKAGARDITMPSSSGVISSHKAYIHQGSQL